MNNNNNVNIISEIGINHNGDINLAKELILESKKAGCKYIKFQKRCPDLCVPESQKNKQKSTPWGNMTYLEYKWKIEFNKLELDELFSYAKELDVILFASVWDKVSVDIMKMYTNIGKIPSALINDLELCKYARDNFDFLIISTGMSTEQEITDCIQACNPDVIMHTNSTYPCKPEELNLNYIKYLINKYPNKSIGYSGHELGIVTSCIAVAFGATWVERHVTLNKELWGSDQKCSLEIHELKDLVKSINETLLAIQYSPGPRIQFDNENIKKQSLRRNIKKN